MEHSTGVAIFANAEYNEEQGFWEVNICQFTNEFDGQVTKLVTSLQVKCGEELVIPCAYLDLMGFYAKEALGMDEDPIVGRS